MTRSLQYIGESWTFARKQTALVWSGFWLLFIPTAASELLPVPAGDARPELIAILLVAVIALIVLILWGNACTLMVGRRLLQAKAGRTRTSFKAVRTQARALIIPLLLTQILRYCIAFFWSIPLLSAVAFVVLQNPTPSTAHTLSLLWERPWIVTVFCLLALLPAFYLLLTQLSQMVVAYEKIAFRPALKRSRQLLKGRTGQALMVQAVLSLVLLGPSFVLPLVLSWILLDGAITVIGLTILSSALAAIGSVLWMLSLTVYYREVRGN